MYFKNIILILLLNFNSCYSEIKYYNYTLFRGVPVTEEHLQFFKSLVDTYNANFWRHPGLLYRPVEFVVSPEMKMKFLKDADARRCYLTTIIEDVQSAFDKQTVKTYIRRNMESFDWSNYFRVEDIYEWLHDLSKKYSSIMKLQTIGKTSKDRDILAVKISIPNYSKINRHKVIVEGGIHAREWISVAFVTYFLHQILTAQSSTNVSLKLVARSYEWFFVPILNPDGYEISHTTDRMYRKNANGVDLNRNFGIAFGSVGISTNKNSGTYCGTKAFSEPETVAIGRLVQTNSKNLKYYLAFHSYGQYMIIPYAYSMFHQENYDEMKKMALTAAHEIAKRYNTQYSIGTAYDTVGYMTSGVSGCWVKKSFNVPYVMTFELRDEGHYGFALPPEKILPTCLETMDGLLSLLHPDQKRTRGDEIRLGNIKAGQVNTILDTFVLAWNVVLFIIVRID